MHRFYANENGIRDGLAVLAEEDARHAARVLRMQENDPFDLLCEGRRFRAEMITVTEEQALCRVLEELPTTEAAVRITLYQGVPKADKLELIVQKATELGAAKVIPVMMQRSVPQWKDKDVAKKRERWQKIAREAAKQSGRCSLPEVGEPIRFKALPAALAAHEAALVPWEEAQGYSLRRFQTDAPAVRDIAIVIGPEGGITPEEMKQMQEAGARAVTLGPRILRTETAGLAAIAALLSLYGDME